MSYLSLIAWFSEIEKNPDMGKSLFSPCFLFCCLGREPVDFYWSEAPNTVGYWFRGQIFNLPIFSHGVQDCVKMSELIRIVDACKIPLPTVSLFPGPPAQPLTLDKTTLDPFASVRHEIIILGPIPCSVSCLLPKLSLLCGNFPFLRRVHFQLSCKNLCLNKPPCP